MIFLRVRVAYDLVLNDESFSISMIGDLSKERSSEFFMVADMWFGRVVIKKSRMFDCMF
jgi:hypothetical protein